MTLQKNERKTSEVKNNKKLISEEEVNNKQHLLLSYIIVKNIVNKVTFQLFERVVVVFSRFDTLLN